MKDARAVRTAAILCLWLWPLGVVPGRASAGDEPPPTPPWPAPAGVMMQAFYWEVPPCPPEGSWWRHLQAQVDGIAEAGITAVWLPPPCKSGLDVAGYSVYDRYDLGEFDQKGSVRTHYGTVEELEGLIAALHARRIGAYVDIVMNSSFGGEDETFTLDGRSVTLPTRFTFPGRKARYSDRTWSHEDFSGFQRPDLSWVQWHPWDFQPYSIDGWGRDNLMGCEIRYRDEGNRREMIRWGKWITEKLGADGYRLDATKHIWTPFVNEWLDEVRGTRFAVGEAWFYSQRDLEEYARGIGGRMALFDVPLHYAFHEMDRAGGGYDMRRLKGPWFTGGHGPYSVTFVDNHDTDAEGGPLFSPVRGSSLLAYAYILTREGGYPCVFGRDYFEYGHGPAIRKLIGIRRRHAFGPGREHDETDENVYVYSRAGDARHKGLLLILNDNRAVTKTIRTPFANAALSDRTGRTARPVRTDANGSAEFPVPARSYAVWAPE